MIETDPSEFVKEFEGKDFGNQRIRIVVEHLSDLCANFIHIYQKQGDDSITDMLFTDQEARYILEVLKKIYNE